MAFFEDLKHYIGFTEDSSAALRELRPIAAPYFGEIVDDFYRAIQEHPGARGMITGGDAQIARLKATLTRWLDSTLAGPHDEAYFESRTRIGQVHVRIDLPQAYMFTAMNRVRIRLLDVVRANERRWSPPLRQRISVAVEQVLDLDLAIMLETYRAEFLAKHREIERLATVGQFTAGIGHELRNPLSVIDSSLHLLRRNLGMRPGLPPEVGHHLDRMCDEVKRCTDTINDLLARARAPR